MIVLTGTRQISTNPVTTVPAIAPTVPMPDSRPTTDPVSSRLVSRSLVTIGVTAASSAAGHDDGQRRDARTAATRVDRRGRTADRQPASAPPHPGDGQQRPEQPAGRHRSAAGRPTRRPRRSPRARAR